MPSRRRPAAPLLLLAALAACAGGRGLLHPPQARVQELAFAEDGTVALLLRLHNTGSRAARFDALGLEVELDGRPLGRIESAEAREIPPRSVELYRFSLPAPARPARDESASRRWRLLGTITVEGRRFPLEAEGRLDPVPGRPRLYR